MNYKKIFGIVGAVALVATLSACSTADGDVIKKNDKTGSSKIEENNKKLDKEVPKEETKEVKEEIVVEPVTNPHYPSQWNDIKIPEIKGWETISGNYLEEYKQIRIVGNTIDPAIQAEWTAKMVELGWSDKNENELSKDFDKNISRSIVFDNNEAPNVTTVTVWEYEVY